MSFFSNRTFLFQVMELDSLKDYISRRVALQNWFENDIPSVMIIGYDMFRILTQGDADKISVTVNIDFLAIESKDIAVCTEVINEWNKFSG